MTWHVPILFPIWNRGWCEKHTKKERCTKLLLIWLYWIIVIIITINDNEGNDKDMRRCYFVTIGDLFVVILHKTEKEILIRFLSVNGFITLKSYNFRKWALFSKYPGMKKSKIDFINRRDNACFKSAQFCLEISIFQCIYICHKILFIVTHSTVFHGSRIPWNVLFFDIDWTIKQKVGLRFTVRITYWRCLLVL